MAKEAFNEIQVLKSCATGDAAAFESIVREYQSLVCAITYSAVGQVEKSEELAQQAFINAWQNLTQLQDFDKFKAWLIGITRNVIRTFFRTQKRDIVNNAAAIDGVGDVADVSSEPLDAIITKEQEAIVQQSLEQIPEMYREPMVLFYRQQQSTREVAEALDLTEDTVRTRLMRGRKMLKEQVTAMVESTLSHTGPGKAFTTMVVASIAGLALTGATASAATAVTSTGTAATSAGSSGLAALTTGITAKITTAAAVVVVAVGGVLTYNHLSQSDPQSTQPDEITLVSVEQESVRISDENAKPDSQEIQKVSLNPINKPEAQTAFVPNNMDLTSTAKMDENNGFRITAKVIEKEIGNPITEAMVRVYDGKNIYFETDHEGIANIIIPKEGSNTVRIFAEKDGYVGQSFLCGQKRTADFFPAELVFKLNRGMTIGGIVQDPNENAVEGATVTLIAVAGQNDKSPGMDMQFSQKTDYLGRWECNRAPDDLSGVVIHANCPGYANNSAGVRQKDVPQLRDQTHITTITKAAGYFVSGTVRDERGNPIRGARIQLGDWFWGQMRPSTRTQTNDNGYFQFDHPEIRKKESIYEINDDNIKVPVEYPMEYITVTKDDFAPEIVQLLFKDQKMQADFVLTSGEPIYGRVVDAQGNPLEGVTIRADEAPELLISPVEWETKTDTRGSFTWLHAPNRAITLNLSKNGFMSQITNPVTPSDTQYKFTMNVPIRVRGQVIDAVTKEPVTAFTLERGASIQSEVSRVSAEKFENAKGYFQTEFPWQGQRYSITAKAVGHKAAYSRLISMGEQDIELLIEMKPETGIDGIIVDPNGQPLEGVRVISPKSVLETENMRYDAFDLDRRKHCHTLTDAEGRFHLELTDSRVRSIIVLEETGYVCALESEFPADGRLVLQPYAKIVGDYYRGSKPVPNAPLRINYLTTKYMNITTEYTVQTDEQGKFEFDRLMAGTYRFFVGPFKRFHLEPGEVKEVYLGGGGLAVTGQLLRPDGKPMTRDWGYNSSPRLRRINDLWPIPLHEWPLPDNADAMSYIELVEWWGKFLPTEAGDTWFNRMQEQYGKISSLHTVRIGNDGRFSIPDVEAGTYLLTTTVCARKDPNDPSSAIEYDNKLARIAEIVFVPELDEVEDIKKPVDIGQVQCLPSPLVPGMAAPAFDIERLHSPRRLRLSDYRNKPLLINFTNPYMDQSNSDAAAMQRQICEQFAAQQDIAVINVAMEQFAWEYLRNKLKAESTLPGTWGVTQWFASKLYTDYELGREPESVLIDADGNILWKGITNEDLFKEIETLVHLEGEN